MSIFLKHLKFLLSATNQHGVHSPFVFNYITKCIYQNKVHKNSKTLDLLLKSIAYFNYKFITVNNNPLVSELINKKFKQCEFDKNSIDLMYENAPTIQVLETFLSEDKAHNNSMLIINDPYKTEHSSQLWKQIIKQESATVTIDFFYCGVVFKRKEQVKEHFKIRL
ncbi:hypothetical protein GH721_00270 [Kriegella sp. EG-1]|nr:hypothetical protein [Flavobacteriaceae bacterium EG-1]